MYFDVSQISLTSQAFVHAEKMAAKHYRLSDGEIKSLRYDVKTLANLAEHEVSENAFAHLCRYHYEGEKSPGQEGGFYFYRICLQDNRIIDAVQRAGSIIKFPPLILYIAVHELVHVIRFNAGEGNFDVLPEEKEQEERKVHAITGQILSSRSDPDLPIVLDCFSDRHRIDKLLN